MTDLDDLLNEIWPLAQRTVLSSEELDLKHALGRVVTQAVNSDILVPQYDNSAMDGYALAFNDYVKHKAYFISQRIPAGSVPAQLEPGTVARIFTGAPIPEGADAVIMQEESQLEEGGSVSFSAQIKLGQNIRRSGEDVAVGQTIVHPGQRLNAMDIGMLASVGVPKVRVFRRLKVGVLVTGSELVEPGHPLSPGQIYNSNEYTWVAMLAQLGVEVVSLGIVKDSLEATVHALADLSQCDLVLSSGGVSVGEEDHVKAAVERVGALRTWKVAMKPGKPVAFGQLDRKDGTHCWFFGLPGNPVSSAVSFLLIVKPFLDLMQGIPGFQADWRSKCQQGAAHFDWEKVDERREEFVRVARDAQGGWIKFPNQSSGVLTSMQWASGLVRLGKGQRIAQGDRVTVIEMRDLLGSM